MAFLDLCKSGTLCASSYHQEAAELCAIYSFQIGSLFAVLVQNVRFLSMVRIFDQEHRYYYLPFGWVSTVGESITIVRHWYCLVGKQQWSSKYEIIASQCDMNVHRVNKAGQFFSLVIRVHRYYNVFRVGNWWFVFFSLMAW